MAKRKKKIYTSLTNVTTHKDDKNSSILVTKSKQIKSD